VRCPGGTISSGEVFFSGFAEANPQISLDLSEASASGVVRGTEMTFVPCGDSFIERSRPRRFEVEFDLSASSAAQQSTQQVCLDREDGNGPVLDLTVVDTLRLAEGTVTVQHRSIEVTEGAVSRQEVSEGPGTPCSLE
jgi:hypothetical protein